MHEYPPLPRVSLCLHHRAAPPQRGREGRLPTLVSSHQHHTTPHPGLIILRRPYHNPSCKYSPPRSRLSTCPRCARFRPRSCSLFLLPLLVHKHIFLLCLGIIVWLILFPSGYLRFLRDGRAFASYQSHPLPHPNLVARRVDQCFVS